MSDDSGKQKIAAIGKFHERIGEKADGSSAIVLKERAEASSTAFRSSSASVTSSGSKLRSDTLTEADAEARRARIRALVKNQPVSSNTELVTPSSSTHFHSPSIKVTLPPSTEPTTSNPTIPSISNALIIKVYFLISTQIFLSVGISLIFMFNDQIKSWLINSDNVAVLYISFITPTVIITPLWFLRLSPFLSLCYLVLFTICLSLSMGVICGYYENSGEGYILLQALILTTTVFVSVTLYAVVLNNNFKFIHAGVFSVLSVLAVWLLIHFLKPLGPITETCLAFVAAIIFCICALADTSRIVRQYGPDDFIEATLNLYLDFLTFPIFLLAQLYEN